MYLDKEEEEEADDEFELVNYPKSMNQQLKISSNKPNLREKILNNRKEIFLHSPQKSQSVIPSGRSCQNHTVNPTLHQSQCQDGADGDEDNEAESQRSLSQQLFGTGISMTGQRRNEGSSRNTRRKLNNTTPRKTADRTEDESEIQIDASQGSETDFEDSIDVTATLNASSRRHSSGGWVESEFVSSPQLMYGDTHLDASDDEK